MAFAEFEARLSSISFVLNPKNEFKAWNLIAFVPESLHDSIGQSSEI